MAELEFVVLRTDIARLCVVCERPTIGTMRSRGVSLAVCDYGDPDSLACREVLHYWHEREERLRLDEYLKDYPEEAEEYPWHEPIDERDGYVDYQSYIRSREWETKAVYAKRRAGWTCQSCGLVYDPGNRDTILHVHHLHYRNLYKELRQDVQVLCQVCHKQAHGL